MAALCVQGPKVHTPYGHTGLRTQCLNPPDAPCLQRAQGPPSANHPTHITPKELMLTHEYLQLLVCDMPRPYLLRDPDPWQDPQVICGGPLACRQGTGEGRQRPSAWPCLGWADSA